MIVYRITCGASGKSYIGITKRTLRHRWKDHRSAARSAETPLYRAMRKYGLECFAIEVLERHIDYAGLKSAEVRLIRENGTHLSSRGYNATLGGDGTLGRVTSEQARAAMRAASKRAMTNPARRQHLSDCAKRQWENNRTAILEGMKRRPAPSDEQRRKLSEAGKCRPPRGQEWRDRIAAALRGKARPPEVRAKISASSVGKKMPAGFAEAVSMRMKGASKTPEHRAAMRAAWVRRRARAT